MKHFPAPWRIEGDFDDDVTVEIRSADDRLVCEVGPYTGEWTEEEIGNAHVLAASPEVLRQLKALVVQIEASPNLIVPPNVQVAIDKAEGWA